MREDYWATRFCQTNANSSQNPLPRQASGSKETAPRGESSGTVQLEILSAVEGALLIEVVVDRGVDGGEFLQASHLSKPQHRPALAFGKEDASSRRDCWPIAPSHGHRRDQYP